MRDVIDEDAIATWRDRGGIIIFEENEDEEYVGEVPIDRVLDITNPVAEPPWHDGEDVTETGVLAALGEGRLESTPYSSDLMTVNRPEWSSRRHEERIAWLLAIPARIRSR